MKKKLQKRLLITFLIFTLLGAVVFGKAVYISWIEGPHWRSLSDSVHQKFIELEASRGTIFSEEGEILSTSIPYLDVYIDFAADGLRQNNGKRFKENIDSLSKYLSHYFNDKTADQYKKEFAAAYNEKDRYYHLKKGLTKRDYEALRTFPLIKLGRNKSGFIFEVNYKRYTPFGGLAKRTIGLARENAQNVGLERTYDTILRGVSGKALVRFTGDSQYKKINGYEIEPENGKNLVTTLDMFIQQIAENALMRELILAKAKFGICIVMDVKTGKIKAMANLARRPDGSYDESLNYSLYAYDPGPVHIVTSLMALLNQGSVRLNDVISVKSLAGRYPWFRDLYNQGKFQKDFYTLRDCLVQNDSLGISLFAFKAFEQNPQAYINFLKTLQCDKKTGIDLLGEAEPFFPDLKKNKKSLDTLLRLSYGYGLSQTPLRILMIYNAIANGGKLMKPYLVNTITDGSTIVKNIKSQVVDENICNKEVLVQVQKCLQSAITEGTVSNLFKGLDFPVAGKASTYSYTKAVEDSFDEKTYESFYKYYTVYHSSFVGYFPADAPKYSCMVLVQTNVGDPRPADDKIAAPVFKEVARQVSAVLIK